MRPLVSRSKFVLSGVAALAVFISLCSAHAGVTVTVLYAFKGGSEGQ